MFDKDNKFGFIINNNNPDNSDIKKYVDENTVIQPLPVHTIQETAYAVIKVVNVMDLIEGVQYSTHKDLNEARTQSYRIAYVCDDGSFKLICTLPLKNKVVHLVKVLHYTNYSILSVNNTVYEVDYSKHSILTDVQITKTLQNYIPITNTIEYNPTNDYHPATKKYVDDRFICSDLVENVGTIPKEEMQKCNNGTSRYVSSINFKEFFADYKYTVYQGMYGDKNVRIKYDAQYNRMLTDVLDTVDKYNITLGFNLDNNYMYPFSGGASQVKSYQFTNDLVITKSAILNPSEIYSKGLDEYIGTKEKPVLFTEIKNGWSIVKNYYKWYAEYENSIPCGTMLVHKCPAGKNFYITYMNGAELTRYGYNATTHVIKGYKHVLSNEVLTTDNTIEYTPTTDYNPATKKYVDDSRDYYFKVPTILYDDSNLPKGYVDITTLENGTNYRVNSSIVSGFFKVSLKAPNDDGTWFTVDDGSNTIGWSSMLSTSICVQLKSDTFIAINMNCINNYCKYLSITKENGKWKLMQTQLTSISPDNTYEYDVTNDYNPAHKKYVDDKVSNLPQFSFNENGELVVKIGDTTKIFVPKE